MLHRCARASDQADASAHLVAPAYTANNPRCSFPEISVTFVVDFFVRLYRFEGVAERDNKLDKVDDSIAALSFQS
jgi:hypothetical protein